MTNYQDQPRSLTQRLMPSGSRRFSRRVLVCGVAAAAMTPSLRTIAAHEGHGTPEASGTPATAVEGEAEAVVLLEAAAETLAALETFGFELATTRGASTILEGFELKGVAGVVRRPLDVEAEVTVGLPIGEITITAVGLDGQFWVQDPLSDGEWMSFGGDPQIQSLINPTVLVTNAVRLVQDAQIVGTEEVEGVETTVVEGTVDFFSSLVSIATPVAEAESLQQFLAEGARDVTFWFDEENRVVEIEIRGPIFATESDDVVREIRFFDFNEPVQIEVPEGV
jgi:hypothetical protein